AVPLAWLLFRFVERPVIGWHVLRARTPLLTGMAAAAASLSLIATAGAVHVGAAQQDTATDRTAEEVGDLTQEPAGTDFVPANLQPSLDEADSDNPSIYDDGCHRSQGSTDASGCQVGDDPDAPLVLLFGDSHAASWYPALAELGSRAGSAWTRTRRAPAPRRTSRSCSRGWSTPNAQWRAGVLERIGQEQPDLVLLANYGASAPELEGETDDFAARWQTGMESTIEAIDGPEVAVLADVPHDPETPAVCLSDELENAGECATPISSAFDPRIVRA